MITDATLHKPTLIPSGMVLASQLSGRFLNLPAFSEEATGILARSRSGGESRRGSKECRMKGCMD